MEAVEAGKKAAAFAAVDENIKVTTATGVMNLSPVNRGGGGWTLPGSHAPMRSMTWSMIIGIAISDIWHVPIFISSKDKAELQEFGLRPSELITVLKLRSTTSD